VNGRGRNVSACGRVGVWRDGRSGGASPYRSRRVAGVDTSKAENENEHEHEDDWGSLRDLCAMLTFPTGNWHW
jgi:hypothetical protein